MTITGIYPGSITGATRLGYFGCFSRFTLRLEGPFNTDLSRRSFSIIDLLSGAMFNAYSSSSMPCFGDYKPKVWDVNEIGNFI
jgi:hypothetical protein